MAYGQQNQGQGQGQKQQGNYGSKKFNNEHSQVPEREKSGEREPDAGIGYQKTSKNGVEYITITLLEDMPKGTKLSMFTNDKVKNRSEKTPTHILKKALKRS
jgi:hypothetical protein